MHKNCFVLALLLLSVHAVSAVLSNVDLEDVKGRLGLITPRRDAVKKEEEDVEHISVVQFGALRRRTHEEKEKREALEERLQKVERIVKEAKEGSSPVSPPELLARLDGVLSDEANSSDEKLEEGVLVEQKLEEDSANVVSSRGKNLPYYDSPCGSSSRICCVPFKDSINPYSTFEPYYSEWP